VHTRGTGLVRVRVAISCGGESWSACAVSCVRVSADLYPSSSYPQTTPLEQIETWKGDRQRPAPPARPASELEIVTSYPASEQGRVGGRNTRAKTVVSAVSFAFTRSTDTIGRMNFDAEEFLPNGLPPIVNSQTELPAIAKNDRLMAIIDEAVRRIPTQHQVIVGDSILLQLEPGSVQLVLTSPPYWTLKEYRESDGQLGHVENYETFLRELDRVWERCYQALVPGGRLICVVGDVCLSRRKNDGRHTVVPLHAAIQERCRIIGFDNLAPIISVLTTLRRSFGTRFPTQCMRPLAMAGGFWGNRMNPTVSSRTTSSSY